MKLLHITLIIFFISSAQSFSQNVEDSVVYDFNDYSQEIKSLFESHYNRSFEFDSSMNDACVDYMARLIDGRTSDKYARCNFFVCRRFKKSAFENSPYITKNDVYFADFRLEFVEDILNNPQYHMPNADKLHVVCGEYKDYAYVVVGVSSTWYDDNANWEESETNED